MRKIAITDAKACSINIDEQGRLELQVDEVYTGEGAARGIGPEVYDDGGVRAFNGMGLAENLRPKPLERSRKVVELYEAQRRAETAEGELSKTAKQAAAANVHPLNQISRANVLTRDALVEHLVEGSALSRETIASIVDSAYVLAWNAALTTRNATKYDPKA